MITKTFTIPTQYVNELIEVFGQFYQPQILNGDNGLISNPQSKAQFASQQLDQEIINMVNNKVIAYRKQQLLNSINNLSIIAVGQ